MTNQSTIYPNLNWAQFEVCISREALRRNGICGFVLRWALLYLRR